MRFGDLIASRASCLCDKTAVIYNDKEYSYAEIDANANSVAAFLRANGIGVGNHVVYIAYNSEMYFEILTACSRIGAVFTPISWRMCAESIIELVDATDAKVLFVSKSFLEQLETLKHSISGERKIIVIDDVDEDNAAYSGCLAYPNEEISSADRSGEGCLMQIYTSGTTSIPKGVMLSDNAICSHALGHLTDICQTGNSVYMCVLPLFHASSSGAIATLIAGATVVVLERFRPKVYLKTIERYKATALSLTPSMFSALLDEIDEGSYDLTSVKSVIYGAEPILAKYIDCDMMVYNGDIKTAVNKVIGAEHFDKEYVDYVNALKYSWGGTTVKLAVDGHLTDLKMLSQFGTLDQEKFYEDLAKGIIPEEVNFFMSNPSNYSKSAAPEGKQMICFTCPHQLDLPEEIEARLVDKMMVTAEKYIPGLSEHIIIKEVLFNSDIMTASGKGGAGIGIGQVAGQTGAYRPKIKLPVEGAYVVGAAAGGAGVGTELAVNSAIEFFDNYCK